MPKPKACPHCGAFDSLVSIGPGVERVEEEAKSLLPQARVAVFSSDTVFNAREARRLIEAMADGQIDILVATQAAAKGHNFPNLTLVGVVDADLGLRGGDLRAAERTYQLLAQATGRAGRKERPGRALLQTWAPEHAVMQALAAQDRDAFVEAEMAERELAGLPPFGRLAAVIVSGMDPAQLESFVQSHGSGGAQLNGCRGLWAGRCAARPYSRPTAKALLSPRRPGRGSLGLYGDLARQSEASGLRPRGYRHRPLQLSLNHHPRPPRRNWMSTPLDRCETKRLLLQR